MREKVIVTVIIAVTLFVSGTIINEKVIKMPTSEPTDFINPSISETVTSEKN